MRRPVLVVALVVVTALITATPAAARHRHGRVHVNVGWSVGWWGPGWYGPGWWGPGWYGPSAYQRVRLAAPSLTAVDTDVSPEHARVFLDGTLIGTADDFDGYPDYLYLEPGKYVLEFRLAGYQSETLEVEAREGRFFPVDLDLKRQPEEVAAPWYDRPEGLPVSRVWGPPSGTGGVPGGTGAAPGGTGEAPPARADVALRPELRRTQPEEPQVGVGAALELVVQPPTAAVYLDGEFVATAKELASLNRALAVAPGAHRIEVMAPGYASRTLDVTVEEGEQRQVVVELEGAGQP